MEQSIVFVTNQCTMKCPRCLTASGPNNQNLLRPGDVDHLVDGFVHLCGGEPLLNSVIGDILEVLVGNGNGVLLYTALPYGFDEAVRHVAEEYPTVKFRFSTSQYLVDHNPEHIIRTCQMYNHLRREGREVGVSGYDVTAGWFPEGVPVAKTRCCFSGRTSDSDPLDVGPELEVVYSDGERGRARLIGAHYVEARKSVHRTSSL